MEEPVPNLKYELSNPNDWEMPDGVSYGSNPAVPSFSSAVSVDYSRQLGRHVFANRNINTGVFYFLKIKFKF